MSYKRKSYTLKWPEGHARHELVVTMRGMSINDLATVTSMKGLTSESGVDMDVIRPVLEIMSKRMVRWNLTDDDDNPVPTDVESLADEDFAMIMDVVNGWTSAATAVPGPLGGGSNSGKQFQEESIPMETL